MSNADFAATQPSPDAPQPPGAARMLDIRFVGSGSEYFRIWIVNLLLTLLTLGLYYPFAKVRRLRYFHGVTEVGGSPLSFHADPWKMLRGYLLVAAMLGLYSVAGQFSATAGAVAFVIVAGVWPALWHSSMRFRLANTGWRGLRLGYVGTLKQAYAAMGLPLGLSALLVLASLAIGAPEDGQAAPEQAWPIFALLLLGVVLAPLALWLIKRQQHQHYVLGPEQTGFAVGLGRFYGVWLGTTAMSTVIFIALAVAFGLTGLLLGTLGLGKGTLVVLGGLGVLLFYAIFFAVAGGYFTARMQNLVWNGTASQHLRFDSQLLSTDMVRLLLKNTLFTVLTLGLYFPFAQVATARLRLQAVQVHSEIDPDQLVAQAQKLQESAAGDAAGDLLGMDIGL